MIRTEEDPDDVLDFPELYLIYNSTDEDAPDGTALNIDDESTVLRIEQPPSSVLALMRDQKDPWTSISVTPMSYDEPDFVQLGMKGSFRPGRKPVPLFPCSDS